MLNCCHGQINNIQQRSTCNFRGTFY
jgi:hypothetical protein